MGMHQGFDLSRFKKVSSDKDTTTLRHSNGHEIKLAHGGLTPKMRADLDKLPIHMAKGGKVPRKMYADPDEPVGADDSAPTDDDSDEDTADDNNPAAAPLPAPAAVAPMAPSPDVTADLNKHAADWANDLQNGHIAPETYSDLFAKKDTLGKIGTIFGLTVGGAGAGLAHQPNMAMDMINNELARDLDAQKQSKANAVNYYNAAGNLMQAGANSDLINSNAALNWMKLSAIGGHLQDTVNRMPKGPFQQQAQAWINQMLQKTGNDISQSNAQVGGQATAEAALSGKRSFSGPVDLAGIKNLGLAGLINPAQANHETQNVIGARNTAANFDRSFRNLDTITAGQPSATISAAGDILKSVAGLIPIDAIKQLGQSTDSAHDLAHKFLQWRVTNESMLQNAGLGDFLPSVYDLGDQTTRDEKYRDAMTALKQREDQNSSTLKQWNLKSGDGPYDAYINKYHKESIAKNELKNHTQQIADRPAPPGPPSPPVGAPPGMASPPPSYAQ